MPAAKHILFSEFSRDGREFIRLWMKADRDGIQDKLAERFNMSVALVYRIRKKLGLPDFTTTRIIQVNVDSLNAFGAFTSIRSARQGPPIG